MSDSNTDSPLVQFPLTRGHIAIVDKIDTDLSLLRWNATPDKGSTIYARRNVNRGVVNGQQVYDTYLLHRVILERVLGRSLAKGEVVDHIDWNGLNNTRANLRLATNAENMRNRRPNPRNTSGYRGVYRNNNQGNWMAYIRVNFKSIYLGSFKDIVDAARAYNRGAILYHGEFAVLNVIPDEVSE